MKDKYSIIHESDSSMEYEVNSIYKKVANIFLIPILNIIPSSSQKYLRKTHASANDIIEHATSHKALEILYAKGHKNKSKSPLQKFFHSIWFNTNNSKAARNRLRLTKREIRKYISSKVRNGETVDILSIASGSARAIVEVVAEFSPEEQKLISATFLDKNPEALENSKQLILENSFFAQVKWRGETVGSFFRSISEEKFDLIEIVGLLDYFDNDKLAMTLASIYKHLNDGGAVLASNTCDNAERPFVTKAVGWEMIYRSDKEFVPFFIEAGIPPENINAHYEPLHLHVLVVAKK